MIQMIFDNEKKEMKNIIDSKNIIQNFSYKLEYDKNSKHFFKNIIQNIKSYDRLEIMEKYHFEKDLKEMREVLHLLYRGLMSEDKIKDKTAEELKKCCNIFPDNIGKRILRKISYIPLIDLMYEKILLKEYINKKIDVNKNFCGTTILEEQERKIFNDSNMFPKDEDFIDYDMRNKYIEKLESEKDDILKDEALQILINQYDKAEDIKSVEILIGAAYWEEKQNINRQTVESLKEAINKMSEAFKSKEKEKITELEKMLEKILKNKILNINEFILKELSITIKDGELGEIKLITTRELSANEIEKIEKIIILYRNIELHRIKLIENNKNELLFIFYIEIG